MDLYQQSGSSGSRLYNNQRHTGGFRFTPNGQLTNGPSLFGNTANLNTAFGSGFSASGNQFNFPLRSNRTPGSNGLTNQRSNPQLASPSRHVNHNHSYGVYSKPSNGSSTGFLHHHGIVGNTLQTPSRSNSKQRKIQGPTSNRDREVRVLTASLERSSLNDDQNNGETSPEPQYRIFKRGESFPPTGSGVTDDDDGVAQVSRDPAINQSKSTEQKSSRNPSDFGLDQDLSDADGAGVSNSTTSSEVNQPQSSSSKITTNNQQHARTAVSLVAEIARFHGLTSEYRLVNETGPPHCPVFTVVLHLGGETHEGVGPSIKKAQIAAAATALEKSTLPKPPPRSHPPRRNFQPWQGHGKGPNLPSLQLSALAEEMNESLHFVNHPITVVNPFRKVTPVTRVAVHIGNRIFSGEGNTFNAAKNMASLVALKALTKVRTERQEANRVQSGVAASNENDEEDESKSPISIVYEMALRRNMFISYETIKEVGPAHMKVFTVQCKVGEEFTTESDGFTKQQAKKLASELMITKLKEVPVPGDNSLKAFHRNLLSHKIIKRKTVAPVVKDVDKASVSPISRLIQIAHLRKYREPEFSVIVSSNVPEESETAEVEAPGKIQGRPNRRNPRIKKPHFVIEVKVGPFVAKGEGPNKKAAKKAAADNALVLLGYPPSEVKASAKVDSKSANSNNTIISAETPSTSKAVPNVLKIISGRSVVPGILVIQNQESAKPAESKGETRQSIPISKKEEPSSFSSAPSLPIIHEGVNKLSYLAQLLGVQVSYSDFPKKNEYLSVVSLGTSPPHVSHGIGSTLDDARNNAAMQVLSELSDKGIENDSASQDLSKENHEIPSES